MSGILRVSQYHPREEAFVTLHETLTSPHLEMMVESTFSDIHVLIPGMSMRSVKGE